MRVKSAYAADIMKTYKYCILKWWCKTSLYEDDMAFNVLIPYSMQSHEY